ncbi:MAG TPA: carbonic anhydrase [Terriglobia bacterium]|nr:carbonic anhydrase [Terriglobia bacterium]
MRGNRRFQEGKPAPRELVARRTELANHQNPQVIVLACSDSRVCPSLVFDKNLGDFFMIRTAGNVADAVGLGSIEFAAENLQSRVLVVLGHEHCGGVAATASGKKLPSPNLESLIDKIRPALESVEGQAEGEELLRLAERANVHQSASDILRNSALLHQRVSNGKLAIIKAIYQLSTGQVIRLPD